MHDLQMSYWKIGHQNSSPSNERQGDMPDLILWFLFEYIIRDNVINTQSVWDHFY